MVDSDLSLEVHSLGPIDILRGLDTTDSSLENEELHHNVIDRKPRRRIHLISHVVLDVGVEIVTRLRGHVRRSRR